MMIDNRKLLPPRDECNRVDFIQPVTPTMTMQRLASQVRTTAYQMTRRGVVRPTLASQAWYAQNRFALLLLIPLMVANAAHGSGISTAPVAGESGRELAAQYDVIVVGAGTGGLSAAMQATRLGASVLLVESTDWLGGQMAAAGVTSMDEGYPPRRRVRERGIYAEFCQRASAYYRAIGKSPDTPAVTEDHFAVEPDVAQRIFYEMIRDTRKTPLPNQRTTVLDLLLRAEVEAVRIEDDRVRGVTIAVPEADDAKRADVQCQLLIDATEYGDVIPLTTANYRVGTWKSNQESRPNDEVPPVQPITWTAVIKQYPGEVPDELLVLEPPPNYNAKSIRANLADPGTGTSARPWAWERFLKYRGMPDSTNPIDTHNGSGNAHTRTHVNFAPNDQHMNVLCIEDRERREEAEFKARCLTLAVLYYTHTELKRTDWSVANDVGYDSPYNRQQVDRLIERHPELKTYREVLYHFPVMAYVRESRRIMGVDTLTAKQIRRRAPHSPVHFASAVAIGDYPVDVHGESVRRELQVELELDDAEDLPERWIQWGYGPFQIPFEAFIPAELDGFLVAEKNLSQSRIASGATRLQPSTMLTGQASGAIAGVACRLGVQPRDVPPVLVQNALLDAGSTLAMEEYSDILHGTELWKATQFCSLYDLFEPEGSKFIEKKRVSSNEVEEATDRLARVIGIDDEQRTVSGSIEKIVAKTRADLARQLSASLVKHLAIETLTADDDRTLPDLGSNRPISLPKNIQHHSYLRPQNLSGSRVARIAHVKEK